jgi:hypothetical protein
MNINEAILECEKKGTWFFYYNEYDKTFFTISKQGGYVELGYFCVDLGVGGGCDINSNKDIDSYILRQFGYLKIVDFHLLDKKYRQYDFGDIKSEEVEKIISESDSLKKLKANTSVN